MIAPPPPAAQRHACEDHHPPLSQPATVQAIAKQPADPPAQRPPDDQGSVPPVFDHRARFQYCHLLRQGIPKGAAARLLGVSPRTIQWAVKNDPDLANRVRQARLECQATAAAQVARAGEKNWRAAAWLLERGRRRRGPGRPPKAPLPFSDPLARAQMKQLARDVLLEVMPELRKEITGKRKQPSPLAQMASPAVDAFAADRQARLAALTAEVKEIRDAGQTPDIETLWRKHLPGVPLPPYASETPNHARNSAHPNAQSSPAPASTSALQAAAAKPFATTAPVAADPAIAQNP